MAFGPNEPSQKAGGINLIHLENPEKAEVVDALRPVYLLKELLQLFRTSKSSYFYCVHAAQKDKYKELRWEIKRILQEYASCYVYRRIYACQKKWYNLIRKSCSLYETPREAGSLCFYP